MIPHILTAGIYLTFWPDSNSSRANVIVSTTIRTILIVPSRLHKT